MTYINSDRDYADRLMEFREHCDEDEAGEIGEVEEESEVDDEC